MRLEPGAPALVDGVAEGFGGRLRAALVCDPFEALAPADKLSALLARPDARGDTMRELYRSLPDTDKQRLARALIDWTFTHPRRLGALSRVDVLSAVPLDEWTDIELAAILDDVSRGELLHFDDTLKRLVRAAKQRLGR